MNCNVLRGSVVDLEWTHAVRVLEMVPDKMNSTIKLCTLQCSAVYCSAVQCSDSQPSAVCLSGTSQPNVVLGAPMCAVNLLLIYSLLRIAIRIAML